MGNFQFFDRGRANFWEGYNFKTGQPVSILDHIQAHPNRFFLAAQKLSVILKKRWHIIEEFIAGVRHRAVATVFGSFRSSGGAAGSSADAQQRIEL